MRFGQWGQVSGSADAAATQTLTTLEIKDHIPVGALTRSHRKHRLQRRKRGSSRKAGAPFNANRARSPYKCSSSKPEQVNFEQLYTSKFSSSQKCGLR
ncbi:MAG: hypothetical protein BCS36_01245 [Desulfovibrio sp. MES5]|nr:MAG: hypothetical protein BCS36_01245 [Desulfovibrio sp. MES5]